MKSVLPLVVSDFEVIPVKLNFRLSVKHSLASRDYTNNVVVRAASSSGVLGYGEGVPRKYVTGESVESVLAFLTTFTGNFRNTAFDSPVDLIAHLETLEKLPEVQANHSAFAAFELAMLDLAGHHWGLTLSALAGCEQCLKQLVYSLVVPLLPVEACKVMLRQAADYTFPHVKVKISGDQHVERVRFVREMLGDSAEIRVDANGALNQATGEKIVAELRELGVVAIEQPYSAEALEDTARLKKLGLMDIVLDEGATSLESAVRAIEAGACDIVNVRVSKCGGFLASLRLIDAVLKKGCAVQLGAQVGESSILSAAGAQLASTGVAFRWLEGCFGRHLLDADLSERPLAFGPGGLVNVPTGQGLGITVSPGALSEAGSAY